MDSEDQMSSQARKRKAAKDKDGQDCMKFLDKMMSLMMKYLKKENEVGPSRGAPFAGLSATEYEKVVEFTAELRAILGLYGKSKEAEEVDGGVWVATPNAKQHLEKRKESKPDQPKTEDDAKKEANWLQAAFTMQAAQIYARNFAPDEYIDITYGIKKMTFGKNLQRYIWIFLGQGSEEKLPWYHNREWSKWKASTAVHPDCTTVLDMWHNGVDIYEILERLDPLSESSLHILEINRKKFLKTASHSSLRPSN